MCGAQGCSLIACQDPLLTNNLYGEFTAWLQTAQDIGALKVQPRGAQGRPSIVARHSSAGCRRSILPSCGSLSTTCAAWRATATSTR